MRDLPEGGSCARTPAVFGVRVSLWSLLSVLVCRGGRSSARRSRSFASAVWTTRRTSVHATLTLGLAVLLSGCAGSRTSSGSTADRKPAMPTIAPNPTNGAMPLPLTEAEALALAARQARTQDFAGAVRALHSGRDAETRSRLGLQLISLLAAENVSLAAATAEALPPGLAQTSALELVGRAWAQTNPDAALAWAMTLQEVNSALAARRAVTSERVRTEPHAVLDRIQSLPTSQARDDSLVLAAGAWARLNPDEALAWLETLPEGEQRQRLTSSVGFEIAQTDPRRAMSLAERLPAGRDRWLLVSAIGQTWVAMDPKAAFSWAQELPEGEARHAALAGIDTGSGVPSTRRVASVPGMRGGASRTRGGTATIVAARASAEPAFELWFATQPPGMSREEAILEFVRQQGAAQPFAVGQMLSSLPGGTVRQQAIDLQVQNLVNTAPEQAADFLRSLPRSEQDRAAVERTARRLLPTNPAAAEALLDQALIPPGRKAELLQGRP